MKFRLIKICDRCGKKSDKHKRFFVGSQWPFYSYIGFDLCDKCEEYLEKFFEDFFKVKKIKNA